MINTYVGPMFSGKSAALIAIYKEMSEEEKKGVLAFKPKRDDRDGAEIKSRVYEETIPAESIEYFEEMYRYIEEKMNDGINVHSIFIDETQFLHGDVQVLNDLLLSYGIDFYISGLNLTSEQKPFGSMPEVMAISNYVKPIVGICDMCGGPSFYTFSVEEKTGDVRTGDAGYIALCLNCLIEQKKVRKKAK